MINYLCHAVKTSITVFTVFMWYIVACYFSAPYLLFAIFKFILQNWLHTSYGNFFFPITIYPGIALILGHKRKVYYHGSFCTSQDECAIIVSNHQTSVDCASLTYFGHINNKLQVLRAFIKQSILAIFPVAGLGLAERGCVPLKRNQKRNEDSSKIKTTLETLLDGSTNAWMVNFVEGTRRDETKKSVIHSSNEFWVKLSFPPTKYVLCPRVTGFSILKESYGDRLTHIYDVTVVYKDSQAKYSSEVPYYAPSMNEFFWNSNFEIHYFSKKYTIKEIDEKFPDVKDFLYQSFQEKDKIIEKCLLDENSCKSDDVKEISMGLSPLIHTLISISLIFSTFYFLGFKTMLVGYVGCGIFGYLKYGILSS